MSSPGPTGERSPEEARDAFAARMKSRMEQAQASGQSPEQIRAELAALAREESRRQLPGIVARTRSWWSGLRNFLIVGALALGVAVGLALFIEHRYAAPICERHATAHQLTYKGIDYPVIGRSSSTSSQGRCIFEDRAGHRSTVSLDKLEPNWLVSLFISFALQIEFTWAAAFVLIALIAVALGKLRRAAP